MREIRITALICAICLLGVRAAAAEGCKSLQNVGMEGLVSYLDQTVPNSGNAECVTFAIKTLGQHRYEPAVSALAKFLDFRRPPNDLEEGPVSLHRQVIEEQYPATNAMEEIEETSKSARSSAVPTAVLGVIGSASSSVTARENAVVVWMDLHRYKSSRGVASLRQEAIKASDPAVRENLIWALSKAPARCSPNDKARCRAAAVMPKP